MAGRRDTGALRKCESKHSLACFLADYQSPRLPQMNITGHTLNHHWLRCAAPANTLGDVFTLFGSSRDRFNPVASLELPG